MFFSCDLSLFEFCLQAKRKVYSELGNWVYFLGKTTSQSVSDGALLSLGLRSANGPGAVVAE